MSRVVVVGDLMVDVVARMSGPLAHGSDTPATIAMRVARRALVGVCDGAHTPSEHTPA